MHQNNIFFIFKKLFLILSYQNDQKTLILNKKQNLKFLSSIFAFYLTIFGRPN
jgi:hypothetical protein